MKRPKHGAASLAFFVAMATAILFSVGFAFQLPVIAVGQPVSLAFSWVPSLGVDLAFHLDGLSLLFALLISVIGVLGDALRRSLSPAPSRISGPAADPAARLHALDARPGHRRQHVILLFVFWELTTVTSFLLVGFDHEKESARRSALQALLVTGIGRPGPSGRPDPSRRNRRQLSPFRDPRRRP